MAKNYGYQYETSPRKWEPEYERPRVKKKKPVQKKKKPSNKKQPRKKAKTKKKMKLSFETKFFINSMLFFFVIFAIIACQAMVEQKYKEKETLKKQYNELLSSANMGIDLDDDVRTLASEYGMQTKSATLIDLETSDFIESSENEVKGENEGIFSNIVNWLKEIF